MKNHYYVTVRFEDDEKVEYYVPAQSAQEAANIERNRLERDGILADVVRVAKCCTDWY